MKKIFRFIIYQASFEELCKLFRFYQHHFPPIGDYDLVFKAARARRIYHGSGGVLVDAPGIAFFHISQYTSHGDAEITDLFIGKRQVRGALFILEAFNCYGFFGNLEDAYLFFNGIPGKAYKRAKCQQK